MNQNYGYECVCSSVSVCVCVCVCNRNKNLPLLPWKVRVYHDSNKFSCVSTIIQILRLTFFPFSYSKMSSETLRSSSEEVFGQKAIEKASQVSHKEKDASKVQNDK